MSWKNSLGLSTSSLCRVIILFFTHQDISQSPLQSILVLKKLVILIWKKKKSESFCAGRVQEEALWKGIEYLSVLVDWF